VIKGISPKGEVAAFPDRITWDAVPGATEYKVTLSEVDRTVIFDKTFTSNVLELTDEERKLLLPRKTVLLLISASDAAGNEIARSGTTRVTVRPAFTVH
jgi:hypothetical protein